MCVYIFSGRFQPFHNGHMQVFRQLCGKLTQNDILVLGVIAPFESDDVKDVNFLEASKEHQLPERNPWDVLVPLSAVAQIARSSHYSGQIVTTLLPRPEYGWKLISTWFPNKRIWVIPSAGEEFDEKKSEFFTKMGDQVVRFKDTTGISGRELREFYKEGEYEKFVSCVPSGLADIYFRDKPDDNAQNDFQTRAHSFESHSSWVTDRATNDVPREFFQQRNIGNLLDAGGGTGYLSWYLYQNLMNRFKTITLVDISHNMLDEAKRKKNYPVETHNSSIETFCQMTTHKFDTILIRQVLHYVDDVDTVIKLLKSKLSDNGYIYVGQILVEDNESKDWHDELMKGISKNRRRTFVYDEFISYFEKNGFEVVETKLTNFEESFANLYERRVRAQISPDLLKSKMESLATNTLREKLLLKFEGNNLYFTVKFCHLLLQKSNRKGD